MKKMYSWPFVDPAKKRYSTDEELTWNYLENSADVRLSLAEGKLDSKRRLVKLLKHGNFWAEELKEADPSNILSKGSAGRRTTL